MKKMNRLMEGLAVLKPGGLNQIRFLALKGDNKGAADGYGDKYGKGFGKGEAPGCGDIYGDGEGKGCKVGCGDEYNKGDGAGIACGRGELDGEGYAMGVMNLEDEDTEIDVKQYVKEDDNFEYISVGMDILDRIFDGGVTNEKISEVCR
jgi:hypothetical protein